MLFSRLKDRVKLNKGQLSISFLTNVSANLANPLVTRQLEMGNLETHFFARVMIEVCEIDLDLFGLSEVCVCVII